MDVLGVERRDESGIQPMVDFVNDRIGLFFSRLDLVRGVSYDARGLVV